jgi:hypothetical protein
MALRSENAYGKLVERFKEMALIGSCSGVFTLGPADLYA